MRTWISSLFIVLGACLCFSSCSVGNGDLFLGKWEEVGGRCVLTITRDNDVFSVVGGATGMNECRFSGNHKAKFENETLRYDQPGLGVSRLSNDGRTLSILDAEFRRVSVANSK